VAHASLVHLVEFRPPTGDDSGDMIARAVILSVSSSTPQAKVECLHTSTLPVSVCATQSLFSSLSRGQHGTESNEVAAVGLAVVAPKRRPAAKCEEVKTPAPNHTVGA